MEHITIGEFEKKLRNVFVRVADDQEPISVVMDEGKEVILVDGDEYRSVMETFYLLRSPANAERLRQGIKQHKEGKTKSINVVLTWTDTGLDDLAWWVDKNPKILKRIMKLCLNTCKTPRSGIGKPEQNHWAPICKVTAHVV